MLHLRAPLPDIVDVDTLIRTVIGTQLGIEFASPVFTKGKRHWMIVTQDVLVRVDPEHQHEAEEILGSLAPDLHIIETGFAGIQGAYRLRSPARNGFSVLRAANRLALDPRVAWAQPNTGSTGRAAFIPDDPLFDDLWGIRNTAQLGGVAGTDMDGDLAWDITTGSSSIRVLVLDDGVQQNHPDINQSSGADFTWDGPGNGGPVGPCDNHGTQVAGCVSAKINNSIGIVGIAPSCHILSARAHTHLPFCVLYHQADWVANALAWGLKQGARVSNNSNFYEFPHSAIDAAYAETYAAGMVHFASAGNDGEAIVDYPASLGVVHAISALDPGGLLAGFSNYGADVDFSAPGDLIRVTDRTGVEGVDATDDYAWGAGTSFASPYAAGVAALILSRFPLLTPAEVELLMHCSARDLGPPGKDVMFGWGLINAYDAVRSTEIGAPIIISQPEAQEACEGSNVTLSVDAAGTGPHYQWRKDGQDIDGATQTSFKIDSVTPGDAGGYDVVISNGCGSVTSDVAMLSIIPCPIGACCAAGTLICSEQTEHTCMAAAGTYLGNGTACVIPPYDIDACDCDGNGTLDRNELSSRDCNSNGILDPCDIDAGISTDVNGNGIPDECEEPAVSNGYVTPTSGSDRTVFQFRVTYTDPTGREPLQANAGYALLGGEWSQYAMTPGKEPIETGRVYRYETQLDQGSYVHRFHFETADGHHIYWPSTNGNPGPSVGTPDPLRVRFCAADPPGSPWQCAPEQQVDAQLFEIDDVPSIRIEVRTPDGQFCGSQDCFLQLLLTPSNPYVTPIEIAPGIYEYGTKAVPATNWRFGCGCYNFQAVATHADFAPGEAGANFETCACPSCPPVQVTAMTVSPGTAVPGTRPISIEHSINVSARETIWVEDANGTEIRRIVDGIERAPGPWSDSWDGLDNNAAPVTPDEYRVAIEALHVEPPTILNRFGLLGSADGQLGSIRGLTWSNGRLYVLTWISSGPYNKIVAFDRDGIHVPSDWILPLGSGSTDVSAYASGLTSNPQGRLYIFDQDPEPRVTVWNATTRQWSREFGRGQMRDANHSHFAPITYDPHTDRVLLVGAKPERG